MSAKSWMYPPDELTDGQRKIFDMMAPEQNTAPRAALLADRPEVAKIVSQLNDIDAPISDKAADLIESLAAQLAAIQRVAEQYQDEAGRLTAQLAEARALYEIEHAASLTIITRAEKAEAELAKLKALAERKAVWLETIIEPSSMTFDAKWLAEYRTAYPKDAP